MAAAVQKRARAAADLTAAELSSSKRERSSEAISDGTDAKQQRTEERQPSSITPGEQQSRGASAEQRGVATQRASSSILVEQRSIEATDDQQRVGAENPFDLAAVGLMGGAPPMGCVVVSSSIEGFRTPQLSEGVAADQLRGASPRDQTWLISGANGGQTSAAGVYAVLQVPPSDAAQQASRSRALDQQSGGAAA